MTGRDEQTPGVESLTPPDAAARLTAALGGQPWHGRHNDRPPPFAAQPTGLEPLQRPQGGSDGSA